MYTKIIKRGIAIVEIAILAFLSVACASAPESSEYRKISPHELRDYRPGGKIVTETRLKIVWGDRILLVDANHAEAFLGENLKENLLEERILAKNRNWQSI